MTADEVRRFAPECTRIAARLRWEFGEAKIERLSERGFELGKPDERIYATCLYAGDGLPIGAKR